MSIKQKGIYVIFLTLLLFVVQVIRGNSQIELSVSITSGLLPDTTIIAQGFFINHVDSISTSKGGGDTTSYLHSSIYMDEYIEECEDVSISCFVSPECDATEGESIMMSVGEIPESGESAVYALTYGDGTIVGLNVSSSFNNISSGGYFVYQIRYETSFGISGAIQGQNVNDITSAGELVLSREVLVVCPSECNLTTEETLTFVELGTAEPGHSLSYILTDGSGIILRIESVPSFGNVPSGDYYIYQLILPTGVTVNNIAVGNNIDQATISSCECYECGPPQRVTVCEEGDNCIDYNVSIGSVGPICQGESLTLNVEVTGGVSPYTYNWSNGTGLEESQEVIPLETSSYIVTVTDGNDCSATTEVLVVVNDCTEPCVEELISCFVSPECDATEGESITMSVGEIPESGESAVYALTYGDGTIVGLNVSSSFNNISSGGYFVYQIRYKTSFGISGAIQGQNVNDITSAGELVLSREVLVVCPSECNLTEEDPLSFEIIGSNPLNYEVTYILTGETGVILNTAILPDFGTLSAGNYFIYQLGYPTGTILNNLTIGSNINQTTINSCECYICGPPIPIVICDGCEPYSVIAGLDQNICSGEIVALSGNVDDNSIPLIWTTSGDGEFTEATNSITNYIPGPNDLGNGSIILTLSTNDPSCPNNSDDLVVNIECNQSITFISEAVPQSIGCEELNNSFSLQNWISSNGGALAQSNCNITWSNDYNGLTGSCPQTATVTFTASDECGNTATTIATISIQDETSPDITTQAQSLELECDGSGNSSVINGWLSSNGGANASDICSVVSWSNDYNGLTGSCPQTATVTFTASDECGNTATTTATISIQDETSPDITTQAQSLELECDGSGNSSVINGWLSSNGGANASDICSVVSWSNDYNGLTGSCPQTATVTFTASDECGNTATTTATISIQDETSPDITTQAQSLELECDGSGNSSVINGWLSSNGGANASDICSVVSWSNDYNGLTGSCPQTATVTFTASDECGNTATTIATISIQDETSPDITTQAQSLELECDGSGNSSVINGWLSSNGGANASDICSVVSWSNDYNGLTGSCPQTATVTFTASDECGNTSTTTSTISIQDETPPEITTQAQSLELECDGSGNSSLINGWLSSNGGANASDICSVVSWSNDYNGLTGSCPQTATVTFTASDECGNTSTTTSTISIQDETPPEITTQAQSLELECDGSGNSSVINGWLSSNGGANTSDICSVVNWSNDYNGLTGSCPQTATVTFTASDECGNTSTTTSTISIQDETPPEITTQAQSLELECDGSGNSSVINGWLSSNGGANASDICSVVSWSNDYNGLTGSCPQTATVTFTASDECGNTATTIATISIQDETSPDITTQAQSLELECDGSGNVSAINDWLNNNGGANASDNCSVVNWSNDYNGLTGSCPQTATVTFTASDECGNTATTIATISIQDETSPDITTQAQSLELECDGSGNVSAINDWLNNNGGANASDICSVVSWSNDYNGLTGSCPQTATVTFTASDECGNTATTIATISIQDETSPDITTQAQSLELECDGSGNVSAINDWLNNNGGANASDNCSVVNWSNDYNGLTGSCPQTATVTFTASDECGNTSTTTSTISIQDETPPEITTQAQSLELECDGSGNVSAINDWLNNNGGANASDNCSVVIWSNDYNGLTGSCPQTATVTFTASDECGNTSTTTSTISIQDETPPEITTQAQSLELECDGSGNVSAINDWLNNNGGANASDICSVVIWSNDYNGLTGSCPQTATVTFTASDECGNTAATIATISIQDETSPDITTQAQSLELECDGSGNVSAINDWLNNNGGANASDNCSVVNWSNDYNGLTGSCPQTATVTFTASDECGNTSTTTSTISIQDETPPEITTQAQSLELECDGSGNVSAINDWLNNNGGANASDNCSVVIWSNDYNGLTGSCPQTATVTFTASDECGNTSTTTSTISIQDETPPEITTQAQSLELECDGSGNVSAINDWLNNNGGANASDICSVVIWSNDYNGLTGSCPQTATVTFTASDECGNTSTTTSTISIQDETPPEITTQAQSLELECDGSGNVSAINDWLNNNGGANASDNCSVVIWSNDYNGLTGSCPQTATVTFTASDECGNTSTTTSTISIQDETPPEITTQAQSLELECDGSGNVSAINDWLSNNGGANASDNCSVVSWSNDYNGLTGSCPQTATVTFTASDECGNTSTTIATISIQDETPPEINGISLSITVSCENVPEPIIPVVTDNCDENVSVSFSEEIIGDDNSGCYEIIRIWIALDECGNENSKIQEIIVEDSNFPELFNIPDDLTIELFNGQTIPPVPNNIIATDNCDNDVVVSFTESVDENGCTSLITRNWTVTDNCGNSTSESQEILVLDNLVVQVTPENISICINQEGQAEATVIGGTPPYSYQWTLSEGTLLQDNVENPVFIINQLGSFILTATITDANNCQGFAETIVEVSNQLGTEIIGDTIYCETEIISLTVLGGTSWNWSGPNGFTANSQTIDIPDAQLNMSGTYTVEVIDDNNGCSVFASKEVEVIRSLIVTVTSSSPVCEYGDLFLFATGQSDYIYEWTGPNGWTSSEQNPVYTNIDLPVGVYEFFVNVTPPNECEGSGSVIVEVIEGENVSVSNDVFICEGEILNLNVNGGADWLWQGPDNFLSLSQTVSISNATTSMAGIYYVDIFTEGGCQYRDSVLVSVIPNNSIVEVTYNDPVCEGNDLELFVDIESVIYQWSGPNGFTSSEQNPVISNISILNAGIYSVTVSNPNVNCDATGSVEVEISEINSISVEYSVENVICEELGSIIIDLSGNYTFDWADLPGEDNQKDRIDLEVGVYEVIILNEIGCEIETLSIELGYECDECQNPPVIVNSFVENTNCGEENGSAGFIMLGGNSNYTFEWSPNLGTPSGQYNQERIQLPAGVYTVSITNIQDPLCILIESITIGSSVAIEAQIENIVPTSCLSESGEAILSPMNYIYTWSDGGTGFSRNDLQEGIYEVTFIDPITNCSGSVEVQITSENPLSAIAEVVQQPSCELENGTVTILVNGGSGNYDYSWGDSNTQSNLSAGVYIITITDIDLQCSTEVEFNLIGTGGILEITDASDFTYECNDTDSLQSWLNNNGGATVIQSSGEVSWDYDLPNIEGDCEIVEVTFTAEDECGNQVTTDANIIISDTTPPVFTSIPDDLTVNCDAIPSPLNIIADDNCDNEVEINFNSEIIEDDCLDSYSIIRTWVATDDCGNETTMSQNITVIDIINPVILNIPEDITVVISEGESIPEVSTEVYVTDNCDTETTISFEESEVIDNCSKIITRTWTAIDNCDNSVSASQQILVLESMTISITPESDAICIGENGEVIAEIEGGIAPFDYEWDISEGDILENGSNSAEFEINQPGIVVISVTITDAENCTGFAETEITVSDLNSVSLIGQDTYCEEDTITLMVTGGTNWSWSGPNNITSNEQELYIPNAQLNMEGIYSVTISDDAGCETILSKEIKVFRALTINLTSNGPICEFADLYLYASGEADYSYNWSGPNGFSSQDQNPVITMLDLPPGAYEYEVIVTAPNGCIGEESITIEITSGEDITLPEDISACSGEDVQLSVTGGDSFLWTGPNNFVSIQPGILLENLNPDKAGDYFIEVQTIEGCIYSDTIQVVLLGEDSISINSNAPLCIGQNLELSIDISGSNYLWTGPNGFTSNEQNPIIENASILDNGTYSVVVTNENGGNCNSTGSIDIDINDNIEDLTISIENEDCETLGSITLEITGDYDFYWNDLPDNLQTQNRIDLNAGIYEVIISSPDNCDWVEQIEIINLCDECTTPPVISEITTSDANCNQDIGTATIDVLGNDIDFSYEWFPDIGTSIGPFDNQRIDLPAGNYTVTVTSNNEDNCFSIETFNILTSDGPQAEILSTSPANCFNNDGSATLSPANFQYLWSDGELGAQRTDLIESFYTITVTDPATECSSILELEISSTNPLSSEVIINQHPTCGLSNGSITINISGGSGNYNYSWGNSNTQENLNSGFYNVTVTDSTSGCTLTEMISLTDTSIPQVTINALDIIVLDCHGDMDGVLYYEIIEDEETATPLEITFINNIGNQVSNGVFSAGEYCMIVTDANNCLVGEHCFEVTEPDLIQVNYSTQNVSCDSLGTITLIVSGGTGLFTYDWEDEDGSENEKNRTDLMAGVYSVTITDQLGCTNTLSISVADDCSLNECEGFDLSYVLQTPTCNENDGSINLMFNGNESDYHFAWVPSVSTNSTAANLPAGIYEVTVTLISDPDCQETTTILVENEALEEPAILIAIDPGCELSNGIVQLSPDFTYEWPDGSTASTRTDLEQGYYLVTAFDNNGCQFFLEIQLSNTCQECESIQLSYEIQSPTCNENDGSITLMFNGNESDYHFAWVPNVSINSIAANLPAGIYEVTVTLISDPDCQETTTILVENEALEEPAILIAIDPGCELSNGIVQLSPDFTYEWPDGSTASTRTDLEQGYYLVTAFDNNGCQFFLEIQLSNTCQECESIQLSYEIQSPTCNENDGSINLMFNGNESDYHFAWVPSVSINSIASNLPAGIYEVTVTLISDPDCQETTTILVENEALEEPAILIAIDPGCELSNGIVQLSPDFTYEWPDGSTASTRTDLEQGYYLVAAFDNNGCQFFLEIQLSNTCQECESIQLSYEIQSPTCNENDGSITLMFNGNESDYHFAWVPSVSTNSIATNLPAGIYEVTVTLISDPDCRETATILVENEALEEPVILIAIDPGCELSNGIVQLSPDFTYEWPDGSTASTRTDLEQGYYLVTAFDNNGCQFFLEIQLSNNCQECESIQLNYEIQSPNCNENDGSITLMFNGNESNYHFAWAPSISTNSIAANLPAGIYEVTVTLISDPDCQETATILVENPSTETPQVVSLIDPTCNNSDGQISLSPSDLEYLWDDGIISSTRDDLDVGNYIVTVVDANGCISFLDITMENTCENCSQINLSYELNAPECGLSDGSINISINGQEADYNFQWSPNVGSGTAINNLSAGAYSLTVTSLIDPTCQLDTLIILENLSTTPIQIISFENPICGNNNGSIVLSPPNLNYVWSDGGTGAIRNDLISDNYIVTATDANGCQTIIEVELDCNTTLVCPEIWEEQVIEMESLSCDPLAQYCLDVPYAEVVNYQITVNGVEVSNMEECQDESLQYAYFYGAIPGIDDGVEFNMFSWELNGTNHSMTFTNIYELADSLSQWDELADWEVDEANQQIIGGSYLQYYFSMYFLNMTTGAMAIISPNFSTINFSTAIKISAGTNQIHLTNIITGCKDSIIVDLTCRSSVDTLNVDIEVGNTDTFCLESMYTSSFLEFCDTDLGNYSSIGILDSSCFAVDAFELVGIDTFCLISCDTSLLCDTIYLTVNVTDQSPEANDDHIIMTYGNLPSDQIGVLSNDEINGTLIDWGIINGASYGDVLFDQQFGFSYLPFIDSCGFVDTFTYFISNAFGSDTATVYINILCENLIVYSGISPNGDGINDTFTILGIESYPDNKVMIFNRWGNEVYFKKSYRNEEGWDGSWKGKTLPDGTYFYIIEYENKSISGYIQINR